MTPSQTHPNGPETDGHSQISPGAAQLLALSGGPSGHVPGEHRRPLSLPSHWPPLQV
jgi:hypothetical protein